MLRTCFFSFFFILLYNATRLINKQLDKIGVVGNECSCNHKSFYLQKSIIIRCKKFTPNLESFEIIDRGDKRIDFSIKT